MSNRPALPPNTIRYSVVVAVCCAALVIVVRAAIRRDPLRSFQREYRVVEGRISGLQYATYRILRSGDQHGKADGGFVELEKQVTENRSADNLRRLAAAHLAIGDSRPAIALLTDATVLEPKNATVLADLAAAELTLDHFADAAEYAARALEIDPRQESAAFNVALALEKLANRFAAVAAWDAYLELDDDSEWSVEARRHVETLRAPRTTYEIERELLSGGVDARTIRRVARQYPQRARARACNILLPLWVESGQAEILAAIRVIAETRAADGDPYLNDVVEHTATHRAAIADGVRAYVNARKSESAGDWDAAARQFTEAAELLHRAGSPLALGAEVYGASAEMTAGRNTVALDRATSLGQVLLANGSRYPSIDAEAAWIRGLIHARGGETNEALEAYRYALSEARRAGEIENETAIAELMASRMAAVGEIDEADHLRTEVLQRLDQIGAEPRRLYVGFEEMAFLSLRAGRPHVSLAFADASAELAKQLGDPLYVAESSERRALALHEIGREREAERAITFASAQAMAIITPGARDRVLSEIDYTTGRIEMRGSPARAVAAYTSAIEIWSRYGWRNHTAGGLLARGEVSLAAGSRSAAERDFRAAIDEIEKQRADIAEPVMRIAYFERYDSAFDALITLLLDEGRAYDALSVVERKRSRFLLDQIAGHGTASPMTAADLARAVAPGTAVLEIALLERGTAVWLISGGRIAAARTSTTGAAIESIAIKHLQALHARQDAESRSTGRWLYDQLLGPVAAELEASVALVIVPDSTLQSFPFATLIDPSGRFLIQQRSMSTAPSASVLLRLPAPLARDSLLAVAQPQPEGFTVLPNATREAEDIARSHPHGRVAVGESITPEQFLESASRAALVHFSGHATTDHEKPFRSSLLFESDAGATRLTAERVAQATLGSHPFVVLAACGTGGGRLRRNEGVASIATAFLQAGARGVAATLWDIDDAESSRLFRSFHEQLRGGVRETDALRKAQVALLQSTNRQDRFPDVWGSVTVIGKP
jgi:CHAT domain-containing protein